MAEDNPFAPPSGEPVPRRPSAPDWQHPAYQRHGWDPYAEQPPSRRGIPRSLVAACHTSAAGAWVFVLACGTIVAAFTGDSPGLGILLLFAFGGIVAIALVAGLAVAVTGLVVAVPLAAIWWGERHERRDDGASEKAALAHLAVAWLFAGYFLARVFF